MNRRPHRSSRGGPWLGGLTPLALVVAVLALVLAAAPRPAAADPFEMTLRCNQVYFFTPTLPTNNGVNITSAITSSDPAVASGAMGRFGGGTSGAVEITAHGQSGSAVITYRVSDRMNPKEFSIIKVNIAVDCPQPPGPQPVITKYPQPQPLPPPVKKTYPQPHTVVTSCKDCQVRADELNAKIDAFNDDVAKAKGFGSPQLDAELASINALAVELNACEKKCPAAGVSYTAPVQTPLKTITPSVTHPTYNDALTVPSGGGTSLTTPTGGGVHLQAVTPTSSVCPKTETAAQCAAARAKAALATGAQ
jgi:hypothetical protein